MATYREIVAELRPERQRNLLATGATLVIRLYSMSISPLLGQHCRFAPSCSAYAIAAIDKHGLWHGSKLALRRLARCHPWHPGGWDPVP